jgi:type III secretion system YscQ/HrcQ family protein
MQPIQTQRSTAEDVRCLRADWNGAALSLRLPERACGDWLAVRIPDLRVGELPECFIHAAWDAMIADVLCEFGIERLCAGIRVVPEEGRDDATYPYAWRLSLQAVDTGRTLSAELAVDEAGLQRLAELLDRLSAHPSALPPDAADASACPDGLPVALSTKVGDTMLDMETLRNLEPGDVVLFDRCLTASDGGIWLTTGDGQGLCVRPHADNPARYVVTQEWSLLMDDPTSKPLADGGEPLFGARRDTQDDAAFGASEDEAYGGRFDAVGDGYGEPFDPHAAGYGGQDSPVAGQYSGPHDGPAGVPPDVSHAGTDPWSDPPAREPAPAASVQARTVAAPGQTPPHGGLDIDRIPVRLDFDLGEQSITLGDLRRLQPGELFDLQRRIDAGPLRIRANGVHIGTAELVDIEGRVGARVLTLALDRLSCR